MIKVLSIGTDRKLFEENSAVLERNIKYSSKMEELHIIVFSLKKHHLKPRKVENLYIYPTNSLSRIHYIFDAVRIGKQVVENWKMKSRSELSSTTGVGNLRDVVISCQDPFETGMSGYLLAKKFKIPLQLQLHTDFLSSNFKNSFLNIIRVTIATFLIPRAEGLRVVNELVKNSIIKKFSNLKVIPDVLPVFVDIEKIMNTDLAKDTKARFAHFTFIMLIASRLAKEKRIDIAIRVLKKIVEKYPKTGLIIAGDGGERNYLKSLVQKLKLQDNVVFVGWHEDLVPYYKIADTFLLTSEYEGYGMSLIEAGACGCPIVTTRVGIANTALFRNNENSFVCETGDEECILQSVLSLISDNSKRELFKQEMRVSIKNIMITKEEYVYKYVNLLENLVKG